MLFGYNFFGSSLEGATLTDDSSSAVQDLFSGRYRVKKVREGFPTLNGSTYHVHLDDGGELKVHVSRRSGFFGGDEYYVNYIE